MASRTGYPLETFSEEYWAAVFANPRHVCDNKKLIEIPTDDGNGIDGDAYDEEDDPDDEGDQDHDSDDGNELDIFFEYPRDIASQCVVEKLEDYCERRKSPNLKYRGYQTDKRKSVWLDDRVTSAELKGPGKARQCLNPMHAADFCQTVKKPRATDGDTLTAARRLIYTIDPGPACIEALAETASCHQAPVLRIAVYKYLECKSAIEVRIPSDGVLIFELNLHLPFFLFRHTPPKQLKAGKLNAKPSREWIDLSFLNSNVSGCQNQNPDEVCGLYQAQFSCVITGSDDWRWVAYCFVDGIIDVDLIELPEADLSFDPISAGKLEAALPIWRPREYWIKIFEIRISQVRKEWELLIWKIEISVNQYRKGHPSILSGECDSMRDRNESMKRDFDWTQRMIRLLSQLDGVLSHNIALWDSFNSADGEINLFRKISHQRSKISVDNIKATFRLLQGDRNKILQLKECCSGFSKALKLSLSIESKAAADQSGATSEFMALILYPVALAAALFSMQVEVIPVKPSKTTFWLAVFILIAVTYFIRLVIRHAPSHWHSWQKVANLRKKVANLRKKVEKSVEVGIEATRSPLGNRFRSMMGCSSDTVIDDLELNGLRKAEPAGSLQTTSGTTTSVATPSKALLRS